jgi:hypothetical protein
MIIRTAPYDPESEYSVEVQGGETETLFGFTGDEQSASESDYILAEQ